MTRRAGTCTIVGAGSFTDMVQFGAMQLMVGAKTLRGCVYGSTDPARDFPEIVRLQQAGRLDLDALVTRRIELDDLNDAFRAMQAGEVAAQHHRVLSPRRPAIVPGRRRRLPFPAIVCRVADATYARVSS